MGELMLGLMAYIMFYNEERFHQALGNDTPNKVYQTGMGGGAMILEKYGAAGEAPPVSLRSTDGASPAEATATSKTTATPTATTSKSGQRRAAVCETSTA